MNLIPPILFLFVQILGLSLAEQAFIAFVITSSGTFFQLIIGYLTDKRGKPWLIILSIVWISFWMSISGLITYYYLLVIILGLGSLGSALFHPLGSAMAVKLGKNQEEKLKKNIHRLYTNLWMFTIIIIILFNSLLIY